MPLNWFRRHKKQEEEQHEALTQPAPPADAPPEPEPQAAEEAATDGQARPTRRRGTRGGRNRKRKPAGAGATATAEAATAEEAKGPEKKPARDKPATAREKPARERREKQDRSTRSRGRRRQQTKRAPLPAAKRELLVSVGVTERRVAVLEDDKVAEVYLERPDRRSIAGNIYLGTVDNVLPGMEAAFVDIGLEKNGFLYVDEIVTPELEGAPARQADPGPAEPRPDDPRPGGQGPDEDEGRTPDDRGVARRPLRRLRAERRGLRRLAPAGGRRAHAPARHPQVARREEGRRHRPHGRRGRVRGGHRARLRVPHAALEDDRDAGRIPRRRRRSSTRRPSCRCASRATCSRKISSVRSSTTTARTGASSAT